MDFDYKSFESLTEKALADTVTLECDDDACKHTFPQIVEPQIGGEPPIPTYPVGTPQITVTVKSNAPGVYVLLLKNSNAFGWPLISIDKPNTAHTQKIFTPFVVAGKYEIELRRAGCESPNGSTVLPVIFGDG